MIHALFEPVNSPSLLSPILPFENKMSCKLWAVSKSLKSQIRFGIGAIAALRLDQMNTTEIEMTKMPDLSFLAFTNAVR